MPNYHTAQSSTAAPPMAPHSALSRFAAALAILFLVAAIRPEAAHAMKIQTVKSPGGIEAWLVEEHSVPLISMRFGLRGGSSQDPAGKEGLANFLSAMLDEGAGDLDASAFQDRMQDIGMRMSFSDARDAFYGNFQTLTANRDEAASLLRLAITRPRFDEDAVERIKKQLVSRLVFDDRDPGKVAMKAWFATAFPGHPYGRPSSGTKASVASITGGDLESYRKRTFARSNLKVAVVGDIDAATLARWLDEIFGDLAPEAQLADVPQTRPVGGGVEQVVEMAVPQSVAVFGMGSLQRKHPDFIPAFVLNHILGGGGFASLLMDEVREKRGLAYSVYSHIQPEDHASVLIGSVATKNESIAQSLSVIRSVLERVAKDGPSQEELDSAKRYLVGSYALRFDTGAKIASQMLGVQMEDMGLDYFDKRNGLVDAVTLDDVKRIAREFLQPSDLIITVVGKPQNMAPPAAAPASVSRGG
ncbi:MAG: M16 family metallopeptidase [Hyphomicrobiaceae bacterium]